MWTQDQGHRGPQLSSQVRKPENENSDVTVLRLKKNFFFVKWEKQYVAVLSFYFEALEMFVFSNIGI